VRIHKRQLLQKQKIWSDLAKAWLGFAGDLEANACLSAEMGQAGG